jgi:uncharacterized protein YkwD
VGIGRSFSARWRIARRRNTSARRISLARNWRALTIFGLALTLVISGGALVAQGSPQSQAGSLSHGEFPTAAPGFSPVPRAVEVPASAAGATEAVHTAAPTEPAAAAAAPAAVPARAPAPKPAAAKPAAPPPPAPKPPAPTAVTVPEVLALVNVERANAGLAPLVANGALNGSSIAHASWMAANGVLQHSTFPGGWHAWGENIAQGYGSAASVVAGWMGSPGHKANILNPAYTQMGIGYSATGNYWCQQFGG